MYQIAYLIPLFALFTIASPESTTSPWYESLPSVSMDYKVHLDAGKEDCYFQYVKPGATFYVSFQVLKGGDGKAGFAVRNPENVLVHPYQWHSSADYQDTSTTGGYYSICVDNQFSRFAAKLINLYITVVKYDEWDKYTQELEKLDVSVENFTKTIQSLESRVNEMLMYQYIQRSSNARDLNLLIDNNSYVQKWSIAQLVVIIATTVLQVYFVKRLFEIRPSTTQTKVRI